ncbi:MAG: S8 family serine peptidase [Halobacteriovoraceae bacterium]|nr:S8 family serine peptidase [Halobacteriovoraceae bacterium]MCB9095272.1 S8 family serine peptidase [Halobacteriovoraceae bacterium]
MKQFSSLVIAMLIAAPSFASFQPLKLKLTKNFKENDFRDARFQSEAQSLLKIVQIEEGNLSHLRNYCKKNGLEIVSYIPENSYAIIAKNSRQFENLQRSKSLKIYEYKPIYKIQEKLLKENILNSRNKRKVSVNIVPFKKSDKEKLVRLIRSEIRSSIRPFSKEGYFLEAKLNGDQILKLAKSDLVSWIDMASKPEVDMDNARITTGVVRLNQISRSEQYTGIGVRGHVLEGIEPNHQDFAANDYRERPIAVGDSESSWHGHNTYGEIFGSGAGNASAKGMLPNAQGYFTNYNEVYEKTGARFDLNKKLIETYGIQFQTASWGYARTMEYTTYSAEMDDLIFHLDLPITQSQSNSGTRDSRPQAWAKNIISVGALKHFDNESSDDDRWDGGASIGPASDGRQKPDVAAYYDQILTTDTGNGYNPSFGGTSGATPIIAGTVGIISEMWQKGDIKDTVTRRRKRSQRAHFTTTKALLLTSAKQYEMDGRRSRKSREEDRHRFHQGWGQPDVSDLYEARESMLVVDESKILKSEGEIHTYKVRVSDRSKPLSVTLVYNEPPADPSSTKQLINDIDLKVTAPNGRVYWGNFGLSEGMESKAGGEANTVDPVERVILLKPQTGTYKIEVIASKMTMDNHLETSDVDLDYALVSNAGDGR